MKPSVRWTLVLFLSPVLLWLFLLIVLPHIDLLVMSFRVEDYRGGSGWSLKNYIMFFNEPIYWLTFVRTAVYSI
ncbi:MAG TPA: ABC transporter permease, partial [Desulfobacteraceae bacterium]|nr:ABC transporter permease [Desulfobacteraceae bacterium]